MSGLRGRLAAGGFAVTAEIGPPRGADPAALRRKVEPLRGWVDAVNITDNAGAHVRMASWAGSLLAAEAGIEPVMQLTCRDRNRLALQSDLLAAAAMGIPNVLLMTGDHPRFGDHPDAKPVFDLDSVQLLVEAARGDARRGPCCCPAGRSARGPDWLIGAVENPFAPPAGFSVPRILARRPPRAPSSCRRSSSSTWPPSAAGWPRSATSASTSALPDPRRRRDRCARCGPSTTCARACPACTSPTRWTAGCAGYRPTRSPRRGCASAWRSSQQIREIPGVSGVHVMAPGYEHGIPGHPRTRRAAAGMPAGQRRSVAAEGAAPGQRHRTWAPRPRHRGGRQCSLTCARWRS